MVKLPTVAIAGPDGGPVIINQSDYDPETHVLWTSPHPPPGAAATEQNTAEPDQPEADAKAEAGGDTLQQLADKLSAEYTKTELYDMASERNIPGRSKMSEPDLALAVATAQIEEHG
jgi:hypothetical protein